MEIFSEKACFKKPVLPEKNLHFHLPAGFFNKTCFFSSPVQNTSIETKICPAAIKIRFLQVLNAIILTKSQFSKRHLNFCPFCLLQLLPH
jgi:hypothetical protein